MFIFIIVNSKENSQEDNCLLNIYVAFSSFWSKFHLHPEQQLNCGIGSQSQKRKAKIR